jgi:hypothetical protein
MAVSQSTWSLNSGSIWQTLLNPTNVFSVLFDNKQMILARTPDTGYFTFGCPAAGW